jgi:hypothetical protein
MYLRRSLIECIQALMNSCAAISHTHLLWSGDADILLYILDMRADEGQDLVIRLHVCIPTRVYTHTP